MVNASLFCAARFVATASGIGVLYAGGGIAAAFASIHAAERWHRDAKLDAQCRKCNSVGPHPFVSIDLDWPEMLLCGGLGGPPGGILAAVFAVRLFRCGACHAVIRDEHRGSNHWDLSRWSGVLSYPKLKKAHRQIEELLAKMQAVAEQQAEEIQHLRRILQTLQDRLADAQS